MWGLAQDGERTAPAGARWECCPAEVLVILEEGGGGGGGCLAIFGGWGNAAAGALIEYEGGGATLQTGIAALAGPVPLARLTEGHVGVGVILAQCWRKVRMLRKATVTT